MTHGGSSALAAYNADQKLIINTYDASQPSSLDKDALYLFFIDNVDGKAGVAGFMPLQRQCGFIYGSPELNIVAHELGHGAFNLYHTFSSENYIAKEQSTDNLMDYKGGTELWKYQWENVQDPQRVWMSWAQGEQEGEATVDTLYELDPIVPTQDVTQVIYCGMTPSGKIIESYPLKVQGKNVTSVISKNQLYFIVGFYVEDSETGVREYYKYEAPDKFLNKDNVPFPGEITYFNGTNCNVWVYQSMNSDCIYKCKAIAWEVPAKPLEASGLKSRIESSTLVKGWELVIRSEAETHCLRDFFNTQSNNPECGNPELIDREKEALIQLASSIIGKDGDETLAAHAALVVSSVCIGSLKSIDSQHLYDLFKFLSSTQNIPEIQEFALIKLMSSIPSSHFGDVFLLLEANNNQLLKHLVDEIDDVSINVFDQNNYTSFIKGLVKMYSEAPKLLADRFADLDSVSNYGLLKLVLPLERQLQSGSLTSQSLYLSYKGVYDPETGNLTIYKIRTTETQMTNAPAYSQTIGDNQETIIAENVPPLSPVMVFTDRTNDLVKIALDVPLETLSGTKGYVVPALFLQYYDQKLFNKAVETSVIVSLDVVTIFSGVGTIVSLPDKILKARRILALLEVAGAVGDIAIQSTDFPPGSEFEKGTIALNTVMGMIGIKNAGLALTEFAARLPESTRQLLRESKSLRATLLDKLREIKVLDPSSLSPEQIIKWEKVQATNRKLLKLLGETEELATAGSKALATSGDELISLCKNVS